MPNSPLTEQVLREDLPLYPPLIQLLRVTPATVPGPAGVAHVAGSSVLAPILYVSFTQQLRTDTGLPVDREPCLVSDMNGRGLSPGFYTGRLSGSHSSLPVYEVAEVPANDTLVCSWLKLLPGYNSAVVQVLGHDAGGGSCRWYNVGLCP